MSGPPKPAAVRVRLPYQTVLDFGEGYRHHLSRAAAFVATDTPRTLGTILQFEFVLQTGEQVLRGEAVVAREPRPQSRPGMLLRFLSLDDRSRDLIERLCPPLQSGPEPLVLGIDFGNRALRAAVAKRGKVELLTLGRERSIAAAVAVDSHGRVLLGAAAQALTVSSPERALLGPKRLLGRQAGAESAWLTARLPFPVSADSRGELAVVLGGQTLSVTRLAGELLRALRERAQEALGLPLQRAVIAVPVHFGDRQRSALRRAAHEAGFSVDQLVNETTAVALACGAGAGLPRRRLAIVDLGGGSFSASVVQVEGDEVETLASGGDNTFGGNEFDVRLANWLAERFESESGLDVVDDPAAFQRLRDTAAHLKIQLSSQTQADVSLPFLASRDGQPVDFKTTVSRADYEALTADLVERVVHLTGEVLTAGKLSPRDCDELILVGGVSAMPLLRQRLSTFFGREPRRDVDGETAVARGAALLGYSLTQREQGLGLREVLSAALLIELPSGELRSVFARHTPLPAERHLTLEEQAGGCRVRVHQGELGQTAALGTLEIAGVAGRPQLGLTLSVDGILHARLKVGDAEKTLEIVPGDARAELPLAVIEELAGPPPIGKRATLPGKPLKSGAGA